MTKYQNATEADIETVKQVFAAINRSDVPGILKYFDPEIVRVEPEGFPMSGTYRGHEEIRIHFTKALNTWAEGACETERFVLAGDKVIVFVHVHVRLKDKTEWIDGRLADVFTFRNGKVIEMRTFDKSKEALEWVGVKDDGN